MRLHRDIQKHTSIKLGPCRCLIGLNKSITTMPLCDGAAAAVPAKSSKSAKPPKLYAAATWGSMANLLGYMGCPWRPHLTTSIYILQINKNKYVKSPWSESNLENIFLAQGVWNSCPFAMQIDFQAASTWKPILSVYVTDFCAPSTPSHNRPAPTPLRRNWHPTNQPDLVNWHRVD